MQHLSSISKMAEWSWLVSKANHSTSDAKEVEADWFYEDLQHFLDLTPKKKKKKSPFHHRGLECKSRNSRDTWRQVWPWSTKWSRAKANRVLSREHLVITNTLFQRHKRQLYTKTSPDGQNWNQIDYILSSWRWRSSTQSAKTRSRADYGSDHELLCKIQT